MKNLRTATKADFKVGTTLITSEGYRFTISSKYGEGIWETRSEGGGKCVFENEAQFYKVAIGKNAIGKNREYNGVKIDRFFSAAKYALGVMGQDKQRIRCDIAYSQWFNELVVIYQVMFNSGFTKNAVQAAKEAREILSQQFKTA